MRAYRNHLNNPRGANPWLLSHRLDAQDASWTAGHAPAPGCYAAKTRYRQQDAACTLAVENAQNFALDFSDAQWAVTPGQSAVLYDGEVCLGGGVIASAHAASGVPGVPGAFGMR